MSIRAGQMGIEVRKRPGFSRHFKARILPKSLLLRRSDLVWDDGVVGSNPITPTNDFSGLPHPLITRRTDIRTDTVGGANRDAFFGVLLRLGYAPLGSPGSSGFLVLGDDLGSSMGSSPGKPSRLAPSWLHCRTHVDAGGSVVISSMVLHRERTALAAIARRLQSPSSVRTGPRRCLKRS